MKTFIFGDYVIQGVPNAFNKKISYWISKRGFMFSFYCFSGSEKEADSMLRDPKPYIRMFDEKVKNKYGSEVEQILSVIGGVDLNQADVTLAHLIDSVNHCSYGFAEEVLRIYQKSCDKKTFEDLFEVLTDTPFHYYLSMLPEKLNC